jgi:hypothetical protein
MDAGCDCGRGSCRRQRRLYKIEFACRHDPTGTADCLFHGPLECKVGCRLGCQTRARRNTGISCFVGCFVYCSVTHRRSHQDEIWIRTELPHLRSQRWHEGMAIRVRFSAAALHIKEQLRQLIQIISNAVDIDVDETMTADKNDGNDMSRNSNNNNIPLSDWQQLALGGVYVTTEFYCR